METSINGAPRAPLLVSTARVQNHRLHMLQRRRPIAPLTDRTPSLCVEGVADIDRRGCGGGDRGAAVAPHLTIKRRGHAQSAAPPPPRYQPLIRRTYAHDGAAM